MTDSASQSLVDRRWTPEQFWEYLDAFVGDWETKTIRTMMADRGLSLAPAARITELEAERDALLNKCASLKLRNDNLAEMRDAHAARAFAAESELSRVEWERERLRKALEPFAKAAMSCGALGLCVVTMLRKDILRARSVVRSLPPLAKRGEQKETHCTKPESTQNI